MSRDRSADSVIDIVGRLDRDERGLTRPEAALLAMCEIRFSDDLGLWVDWSDSPATRFESVEDALDEACARAEIADRGQS